MYRNVLVKDDKEEPTGQTDACMPGVWRGCGSAHDRGRSAPETTLLSQSGSCDFAMEKLWKKRCGAPLFQVGTKLRRYPLAEYIAKKAPRFFRLLVVDEVHQYKAKDSDQGWAFQLLAKTIPWKITLTGTFFGGPCIVHLLSLASSQSGDIREEYGFSDEQRWIDNYGVRETRIVQKKEGRLLVLHVGGRGPG